MNSRLENGTVAWESTEELLSELRCCLESREISEIYEENDSYVAYESDDGLMPVERRIYFPDKETPETIMSRICYDEDVLEYINPMEVANFLYSCIDINAIASIRAIALIYNKAVLDEDGEPVEYLPSPARHELEDMVAGAGCDEYAYEVGFQYGEPTLGMTWVERSAIVINVDAIVASSKEIAAEFAMDYGTSVEVEFPEIFKEAFVQTLCHEFRHAVYDLNEFAPFCGHPGYPTNGGMEEQVEEYGNTEAARLMRARSSSAYVNAMFV